MSLEKHSSFNQKITLGLSVHRPEMIPITADLMRRHDAIFLEEPPTAGFEQMLEGSLGVDDYLQQLDLEYPAFSRNMCYLMRELKAAGKEIYQVEPFLEILIGIHEFFAEGHSPVELDKKSPQFPVYLAERNATGALLAYYQTVMTETFEKTLEAVKQFARLDAARFRLRDSLRARALASRIEKFRSAFIEAGVIHYSLWRLLRQQISPQIRLRLLYLADNALNITVQKDRLYGPGDQLTLLYIFHPNSTDRIRATVLAARSIIFSKIITKHELTDDLSSFPHLRDEIDCIRMTKQLGIDDCRRLFPLVRRATTSDARQLVTDYLTEAKSQ